MYKREENCQQISGNGTFSASLVIDSVSDSNGSIYDTCRNQNGTGEMNFSGIANEIFDQNGEIRIPLYCLIFLLSLTGNVLVIITLAQNRRMRTVTNVFLLNLSISDLLLAVFCMPFTLVPQLMRQFIFGEFVCVAIRYFQGVSVGVSCFTLVTISSERYFAICQPLRSRRWQTVSHSYKIIVAIWIGALTIMIPIALGTKLLRLRSGAYACRDLWDNTALEIVYTVGLVILLLVIPLIIMSIAYGLIILRLWVDIRSQSQAASELSTPQRFVGFSRASSNSESELRSLKSMGNGSDYTTGGHVSLRQINPHTNVSNRKRVIRMLVVIVMEYFMCWTPLYIINTWVIVDYPTIHTRVSALGWSMIQLLAYTSCFIHPITYCFMNKNFRKGFLSVFQCDKNQRRRTLITRNGTEVSSMPSLSTQSPIIKEKLKMEVLYSKVSPDD
ncbi:cholecystokinin receptor type A-like [Mizuhopecten yessoensis]|uniref:Gastrin/cholecystokinin type B receptor n=1 Tax=Mizuhopecten yessoensis TaxID=6573 RepID=A0A210R0E4_MIZYE|nr:cholecystokinin receptor type A-like [Mizuhopecten yessoensis]OWF54496.1 Cholecystokinin receptor [Mizuhopecten yessoensis]